MDADVDYERFIGYHCVLLDLFSRSCVWDGPYGMDEEVATRH